ncbi:hypothetical protein RI367_002152 [Sorochytrium milnesiophthora]
MSSDNTAYVAAGGDQVLRNDLNVNENQSVSLAATQTSSAGLSSSDNSAGSGGKGQHHVHFQAGHGMDEILPGQGPEEMNDDDRNPHIRDVTAGSGGYGK